MQQLIGPGGQPEFGILDATPAHINWRDADARNDLGAPRRGWRKRMSYKHFEYFGIVADDLFAGCALIDTGWVGSAFAYAYRPSTGVMDATSMRRPLGAGLALTDHPDSGSSTLHSRALRARLDYTADERQLTVHTRSGLRIEAACAEGLGHCDPMSLCTRTGRHGWTYARKIAGTPAFGTVSFGGETIDLDSIGAFAHHDYSAGFMRRETFWHWACLSGRDAGHRIGLNVSAGVNETGASENCVWVDGQRYPVGPTTFTVAQGDAPWQVHSSDAAVALTFTPCGRHTERINAGVLASDFRQDFGHFSGRLAPVGGPVLEIEALPGFCEDHFSRW